MNYYVSQSPHFGKVVHMGRVLTVQHPDLLNAAGVVLKVRPTSSVPHKRAELLYRGVQHDAVKLEDFPHIVTVFLLCESGGGGGGANNVAAQVASSVTHSGEAMGKHYLVVEMLSSAIDTICQAKHSKVAIDDLFDKRTQRIDATEAASLVRYLAELKEADKVALDVSKQLKLNDVNFAEIHEYYQQVSARCASLGVGKSSKIGELFKRVESLNRTRDKLQIASDALSGESMTLTPDYRQRIDVLTALGYVDNSGGVVQIKGRVAANINTCNELILTEMIFENVLNELEPEEIAACLSCLINQNKDDNDPHLTARLDVVRTNITHIARSLELVLSAHHVALEENDASNSQGLNFSMMEVIYEWARGTAFKDICMLTTIQEGSIVRTINRLDETCREVRNAARIIGDANLYRKMERTSECIKRDIVFANSLYY